MDWTLTLEHGKEFVISSRDAAKLKRATRQNIALEDGEKRGTIIFTKYVVCLEPNERIPEPTRPEHRGLADSEEDVTENNNEGVCPSCRAEGTMELRYMDTSRGPWYQKQCTVCRYRSGRISSKDAAEFVGGEENLKDLPLIERVE
uniref:Uncharacterized protein n=1 Tax=viral metagenome TaxID=1070528 RepID=A0A6M3KH14_9ZZZZ